MKALLVVLVKELRDNLRDRRTLFVAMLLPLFTPMTVGLVLVWNLHEQIERYDSPLTVPVEGKSRLIENALIEAGCVLVPLEEGRTSYDVAVRIDPEIEAKLREAKPAEVEIIFDSGKQDSSRAASRVRAALDGLARTLGTVRLIERGVSPQILAPFAIAEHDLATPESRMAFLFAGVPFTLIMLAFMGGLYVAIDTTAGERERNSFEALMTSPVPRASVAFGKLFAVTLFAWLALVVSAVGLVALPHVLPERALDVPLKLDPLTVLASVVLLVPLTCLASALQTLVAASAKGFKDAQATLTYVVLVPMVPAMMQIMVQPEPRAQLMWIPAFAEQIIIDQWLRNQSVAPGLVALTLCSTTVSALVLAWLVARRYGDERTFLP